MYGQIFEILSKFKFIFITANLNAKEILNLFSNCNYYSAVINMGNLDKEVIEVLKTFQENRAQWHQIRNALLTEHPELKTEDDLNSLNVKLSRSLKRLEKHGSVTKEEPGHKKVIYQLATELSQEQEVFPILFGMFNPLNKMPTYEEFKKKLIEALPCEGDYIEEYEKFKRNWESFQNIRNLKRKK
jgi:hypothetical protein